MLVPTKGAFDMNLCCFCFLMFIRTDRFGSLTENDVTGDADPTCYFLDVVYGRKKSLLKEIAKINFVGTLGGQKLKIML